MTARTMIPWDIHTWARNTQQSAVRRVLIGRINELIQPISFQMAVTSEHPITVVIQGHLRIGPGATGVDVNGTSVC